MNPTLFEETAETAARSPAAAIAHGIRNPLAAIRAQVELVRDQLDPLDPRREAIDAALEEVERVAEAVESILDHGEPAEPAIRVCNLAAALGEATGSLLSLAERRGVALRREGLDREISFRTDPVLLGKAVRRLLRNAIESSAEGSEAQIFCDRSEGSVEITICDEGCGMEAEDLGRLGEPYFTRKSQGLGLGVHLAKRDLDRLGAEFAIRSKPGRGTTVVLRLRSRRENE